MTTVHQHPVTPLPWMPIYTGDYARQTRELTQAEHGTYLLLSMHYWDTQTPLPSDIQQCYRIAMAYSKKEKENVKRILKHYFYLEDNHYHHAELNQLIEKTQLKLEKLRRNGSLGGISNALKKQITSSKTAETETRPAIKDQQFTILRNGLHQTEHQWLTNCLKNYLGITEALPLDKLLCEYTSAQKLVTNWQDYSLQKRMAAYTYVVRHTHARNELIYALQLLRHNGYGKNSYKQYLSLFEKSVCEENDNEVCFDG